MSKLFAPIGLVYNIEWLFDDPYTDAFWQWLYDNDLESFNNWDTLSGAVKSGKATNYETATALSSTRTVKIELSRNNGADWSEIDTAVALSKNPETNNIYQWIPDEPETLQGLIKITDETDATVTFTTGNIGICEQTGTRTFTITPNVGSVDGGTEITITGIGLTGATGATVNGVAVTDFSVDSDTTITATTAAMDAGQGDVVVLHPSGNITLTGGFTAQSATGELEAPVISEGYVYSNRVKINITPKKGFDKIEIYRDGELIESDSGFTFYIDTTVSADTQYQYFARAVDIALNTADSNIITIKTAKSNVPIEERLIDGIIDLIPEMQQDEGYLYDWSTTANMRDEAKIEQYPCVVAVDNTTEDNMDEDGSIDSMSYSNAMNVEITSIAQLTSEESNPPNAIRALINGMLHDLKKLFGINYFINDSAEAEMVYYQGFETEEVESRDAFSPVRIKTKWKIIYRQKRDNPLVNII